MSQDRAQAEPIPGKGCLGWVARVPAAAGMLVLVASVVDIVQHGPVPRWQANILIAIAVPIVVVFVYLDALIDADFDRREAIGRIPRAFVRDALLLGLVAVYAWASDVGAGAGGGGTPTGGSAARRTNRASSLVDSELFAGMLGVRSVVAQAEGFDTSYMTHALAYGADRPGRRRPRVSITVFQGRLGDSKWSRTARTLPRAGDGGPGEVAYGSGDRIVFRRRDTVVELRLHDFEGDKPQTLARLGDAVDRRLS